VNVALVQRLVSFLELESEDASIVMPATFSSFSLPGEDPSGDGGGGELPSETEGSVGAGKSSVDSRDRAGDDDKRRIRLTKAVVSTLEVRTSITPNSSKLRILYILINISLCSA
jgi:hypothetical protein